MRLKQAGFACAASIGALTSCGEPNQSLEVESIRQFARTEIVEWKEASGRNLPLFVEYEVTASENTFECVHKEDDESNTLGFYEGDEGCDLDCSGWTGSNCKREDYTQYFWLERARVVKSTELEDDIDQVKLEDVRFPGVEPSLNIDGTKRRLEQQARFVISLNNHEEQQPATCTVSVWKGDFQGSAVDGVYVGQDVDGRERVVGLDPKWIQFVGKDGVVSRVQCD